MDERGTPAQIVANDLMAGAQLFLSWLLLPWGAIGVPIIIVGIWISIRFGSKD